MVFDKLGDIESDLNRYSATNKFEYSYDDQTNEINVLYSGEDIPPEISLLAAEDNATTEGLTVSSSTTIKIIIMSARTRWDFLINELEELDSYLESCDSTEMFAYGYDGENRGEKSDEIRVIHSGDRVPEKIVEFLGRDYTRVASVYTDSPLKVKITIVPRLSGW